VAGISATGGRNKTLRVAGMTATGGRNDRYMQKDYPQIRKQAGLKDVIKERNIRFIYSITGYI